MFYKTFQKRGFFRAALLPPLSGTKFHRILTTPCGSLIFLKFTIANYAKYVYNIIIEIQSGRKPNSA